MAYPDEPLDRVWEKLRRSGVGRLPVVAREDPGRIVGFLSLSDIVARIGWGE
ncbi:MAG: CBS domain-containing protein [Caldiserica bacterium]|nr:CBS domain-containing protein [Caldisericota bacterium]